MVQVVKATPQDFDDVYPLLKKFENTRMSKHQWAILFNHPWTHTQDHIGYLLKEDQAVVGFIGLIFSKRDENTQRCNMSSWIVDPVYRQHSLFLLLPILDLANTTLTNFTAIPDVAKILLKLGFQPLDEKIQFGISTPFFNFISARKFKFSTNPKYIQDTLQPSDLSRFKDHQLTHCQYTLIYQKSAPTQYCYMISSKTKKRGLPITSLHYISNPVLFASHSSAIFWHYLIKNKSPLTLIPSRLVQDRALCHTLSFKRPTPSLFKSNAETRLDIDNLYSELLLFNIG